MYHILILSDSNIRKNCEKAWVLRDHEVIQWRDKRSNNRADKFSALKACNVKTLTSLMFTLCTVKVDL